MESGYRFDTAASAFILAIMSADGADNPLASISAISSCRSQSRGHVSG